MNYPGRIIGGTLVAIAVTWILNIAGVFPFNKSGTNQMDQTAIPDPNAQGTGGQSITANNPANRPGTQNYAPGGSSSNGDTPSTDTTTLSPSDGTANSGAGRRTLPARLRVVRAGW
ncbi:hypothetical protein C7B65_11490 [Phormidesmis priestleyi ULC007]|uniref:Uncharacterized protein n=1 Tax=Phormidesmis priestleyi ULC007 TaxID=1920490 RepID=A0A2T1DGE0_9CYAN|nr:hypothetical protein [Phormidesmis priestleyi]PSB19533.1 hypothetical protein C7B65_11490 [Phormidesmis priestleyi ULC007]PZO53028.1 MAG: hypothetical protein DCF14_05265 [Phormidesmis priestleyi]